MLLCIYSPCTWRYWYCSQYQKYLPLHYYVGDIFFQYDKTIYRASDVCMWYFPWIIFKFVCWISMHRQSWRWHVCVRGGGGWGVNERVLSAFKWHTRTINQSYVAVMSNNTQPVFWEKKFIKVTFCWQRSVRSLN